MTALRLVHSDDCALAAGGEDIVVGLRPHSNTPQRDVPSGHLQIVNDEYLREQRLLDEGGREDVFFFTQPAHRVLDYGDNRRIPTHHSTRQTAATRHDTPADVDANAEASVRIWQGIVVIFVAILIGFAGMFIGKALAPDYSGPTQTYYVQPNDSLYQIAKRVPGPVEDTVAQIMALNDLDTSTIVEGQKLLLPTR